MKDEQIPPRYRLAIRIKDIRKASPKLSQNRCAKRVQLLGNNGPINTLKWSRLERGSKVNIDIHDIKGLAHGLSYPDQEKYESLLLEFKSIMQWI